MSHKSEGPKPEKKKKANLDRDNDVAVGLTIGGIVLFLLILFVAGYLYLRG